MESAALLATQPEATGVPKPIRFADFRVHTTFGGTSGWRSKATIVEPWHAGWRTPWDDDWLVPVRERTWSSPI